MFPLRALRVVRIAVCLLPVETKALEFNTRGSSYLAISQMGENIWQEAGSCEKLKV